MPSGLNLKLHKKQLEIFCCKSQVIVLCAGRGFGKSVLMLTRAIAFCISYNEPINPISPQVALIAMPTLKMARAIHWLPLLNLLEMLPIVENVDKSDFRIRFKGERPDLIVRGADRQGDRLRGLNLCFAGLDEFQDFDSSVWDKVLEPALTRNKNWRALVIGTPKGKATYFYQFHLNALKFDGWQYFHFTTFDNPFISRRSLAKAEAELPPKVFRQEYKAGWEDFDGQLFPNIGQHHKASEAPNSFKSVYLGCDWGDVNPCLVVVGVSHQNDYYMLDYWQNTTGLPVTEDEVKAIAAGFEDKYSIRRMYLPDDRPASIKAFRRYGKQHNKPGMQRAVQVQRSRPGIMERALIVNSLFYQDRLWFAPNCHPIFDPFESYHRAKDSNGLLLNAVEKGQNDHPVDAVAYVLGRLEGNHITAEAA